MTDFYPMVLAALAKLDRNTEEARQALYQRARTTLAERLRNLDPPISEQRIMEERLAFEEAVRKAEADWTRDLAERELLAKLADRVDNDRSLAEASQRPRQTWTNLSGKLRQAASGARFEHAAGAFGFAASGTQADRAAAADPLVRSIRAELEYKARDLVGRAARASDRALWSGLIPPLRLFVERIGGSEAEFVAGIGTLWALHVALGAMTEPQEDADSRDVLALPETDLLRGLRALTNACGPWIVMFPAGRALEPTGPSPSGELKHAAAAFLRAAEAANLLSGDATAVVRAVLEGADHHGEFSDKAGHWALLTAGNLAITMLLELAAIASAYEIGTTTVEPPEAARSIERLVLAHEQDLLRLSSHLPVESRQDLRAAIGAIRASAADDV
jgi:hypothetical protein